jgi:hypothetical protein
MSRTHRHAVARTVLVVSFFTVLTLIMAYPLSVEPESRALDLGADTRLFLWTLSWDIHALGRHPGSLFDANIFYPEPNTLAYSEHLVGSALLAAPGYFLSGNPVLAMNIVVLLSCIFSGLGAYFLSRRLGISTGGALVAGVVFAFSPPRFFRIGQLHLATVQWIPFCLAFLHIYVTGGSRRHLVAAVLFFSLQALSGGQNALFLLLASTGLLVYSWASGTFHPRGNIVRDVLVASALATVLNLPFLLPYFEVQQIGLNRSLEEAREWSPNAESFLAAPTHSQSALLSTIPGLRRRILENASGYLFPGFLTLVLAGLAFCRSRRIESPALSVRTVARRPSLVVLDALVTLSAIVALIILASGGIRWEIAGVTLSARGAGRAAVIVTVLLALRLVLFRRAPFSFTRHYRRLRQIVLRFFDRRMGVPLGFYVLLVVLSLWAALGPRFGLYAALYRILPGFDFIRVPARLTLLTLLGCAVLAGVGFDRIRGTGRRSMGAGLIGLMLTIEVAAFPLDAPPYSIPIPPIEQRLAKYPERLAIVELPVPDPRDGIDSARFHSLYMVYSTVHWHRLVNGYSGFRPESHDLLFRKLVNFPDEASLDSLEDLGVALAVLHRDRYRPREWSKVEERLERFEDRLRLELEEGEGLVYRLIRPRIRPGRESSGAW